MEDTWSSQDYHYKSMKIFEISSILNICSSNFPFSNDVEDFSAELFLLLISVSSVVRYSHDVLLILFLKEEFEKMYPTLLIFS